MFTGLYYVKAMDLQATALNVWFDNTSFIYVYISTKSVAVEIACVQVHMEPSLVVLQVSKHLVTCLL